VKPSNVLVPAAPPPATPPAKLTDFGVAHAIGGDSLTATGDVVGTPLYMAPEQAAGRPLGAAADLYSLALVLYEGLTGVNPLAAANAAQRANRLGRYLPPLRRQRRELPRDLGRGIDLALRPRPGERGSIQELREALELSLPALADQRGVVAAPWRPYRARGATEETSVFAERPLAEPTPAAPAAPVSASPDLPGPAGSSADRLQHGRGSLPVAHKRAAAAAIGAVLAGWLAAHALTPSPLAPAAAALVSAGLMLALPRAGFSLVAAGLVILAAIQGHPGEAFVVAVAALIPLAAAPRGEPMWALAGGAPLLGAVALGGIWPAIAARAATARSRAVLGAVGWLWLAIAAPLTGSSMYVALPAGGPSQALWGTSAYDALHHVLGALLSSGALAAAPVWGLAALTLPMLVTRSSLLLDAGRVGLWAACVIAGAELAIGLTDFGGHHATIHNAVLGAVGAGLVALGPSAVSAWHRNHSEYVEAGLP
jgi:serine/threonine-protein kinase